MKLRAFTLLVVGFFYTASMAIAAETAVVANAATSPSLLRTLVSLIVVVGILIALSVLFKKFGLNRMIPTFPIKVIGALNLGKNQRLVVIEVGDEWIVLGATPQHISTITKMPRQEADNAGIVDGASNANFPAWMQGALQKYAAKK